MTRWHCFLIFVFLWMPYGNLASQPRGPGAWYIYIGQKKLANHWNWHHEIQYRNYNAGGDLEQLLLRTGVGRNLVPKKHNLLFGYAFVRTENYIKDSVRKHIFNEHRIFQQYANTYVYGRLNITHRIRWEQRFFANDFRMRFRHFLFLNVPLNQKEMNPGTWYLAVYNELFLNSKKHFYDRDRIYGGLGYKFNDHFRAEAAYMVQDFRVGSRDQFAITLYGGY